MRFMAITHPMVVGLALGVIVVMSVGTRTEAAPIESALDGVTIDGFVSFGTTYNFNNPGWDPSGAAFDLNGFRVFDEDVNSFGADAELVFQKPVSVAGDVGFRIDVAAGSAIPEKTTATGLNLGGDIDLQQAYASYVAPIGSGLRFDIGKHITHMGYEVIEGYDGYNDHYSRSLLFNYAIPFTHTGVKASYQWSPYVSTMVAILNGWDNVEDNNNSKSIGASLTLKPVNELTFIFNYIGGPELATGAVSGLAGVGGEDISRNVYDIVATWTPSEKWLVGVNYDYGVEERTSNVVSGRDARWSGVAGYLKYAVTNRLSLALRAETFNDRDAVRLAPYPGGVVSALPTDISEITFTPSYRINEHLLVRLEGRWDSANRNIFVKGNGQVTSDQSTLAANLIMTF